MLNDSLLKQSHLAFLDKLWQNFLKIHYKKHKVQLLL